ncbi:MAG: hypothetical protein P4L69_21510 [Desulfosporosinus sp.]|nr:hypothetical protein [Desulfosporosinus sp.]
MKEKVILFLCLASVAIGIVLTIKSVGLGENYASNVLRQHGGNMDTATYVIFLQEYINTFRDLGLVLMVIGGLGGVVVIHNSQN